MPRPRAQDRRPVRFVRQLEQEHLLIERAIGSVDAMAAARAEMPLSFAIAAVEFFQLFVEAYHERKEEEGLFPLLRKRADPDVAVLDTLAADHAEGRERLRDLGAGLRDPVATSAGRLVAYGGFLHDHLTRETEVLAPMVEALLRSGDDVRVERAFAAIEGGALPSDGTPTMSSLVAALEVASRSPATGAPSGQAPLLARDVMRSRTGAVRPDTSLQRALEQMTALGVREVPVVEEGALVGILSARDLEPHRGRLEWVPVRTAMSADPLTVGPDTPVTDVARRLREGGINGVPVVEGSVVLGMVSRHELLAALGART